jgi:hypothetical protein
LRYNAHGSVLYPEIAMTGKTQVAADTKPVRSDRDLRCLWVQLTERMDEWRTDWRTLITPGEAALSVADLLASPKSDRVIFEAFAVALVSGNTRWDRIARVRNQLHGPFQEFDPGKFAALSDAEIDQTIVPWFRARKAGAANLRTGLSRLRPAAAKLAGHRNPASAHAYLQDAFSASDGTPEGLAVTLGTSKAWKLPGFGIALAAEALRLLGLDLCKPDRHIVRAMAAWSLVHFRRWDRRGDFTPPQTDVGELRATMLAVRAIADANKVSVSHANSVIWTAGAVSGARLSNEAFKVLGRGCFER